ncbi:MAG: FGGY family carbohydrate kinase, partial [Treponema sp.]|nr:FGGY family carbohydrate kinase [Treponema sp.]
MLNYCGSVMYYLGIDCGTQGTKAIILDSKSGEVIAKGYARHDIIADDSGRREQDARWWIDATALAVKAAVAKSGINGREIKALAASGQQHGCVLLDGQGSVIRHVKLWNDTSTAPWNDDLIGKCGGVAGVWKILGSPLPVGYTASKVRYHAEKEPEIYSRVKHILLPHDYINFYLTGNYCTEGSEASGTGYYDVNARAYSKTMMSLIDPRGILEQAVPPVYSWKHPAGTLRPEAAAALGLSTECLVAAGGGDATMAAVGTAAIMEGCCSVGIGTSGIVSVLSPVMGKNIDPVIQIFEVLDDKWLIVSCTMNATSATTLVQNLLGLSLDALDAAIDRAPPGSKGVQVIPFFDGERIPALPQAYGIFRNLTSLNFRQENIMRATAEA